jgi:uncharacterized protein (TIGR03437 family)
VKTNKLRVFRFLTSVLLLALPTLAQVGLRSPRADPPLAAASPANPIIRTYAGGSWTFQADGQPALNAPLATAADVAIDGKGNYYIADTFNFQVYRVDSNGILRIFAGNGIDAVFSGDNGNAINATLNRPRGVAVGPDGSVYIVESWSIRKVSPTGIITTLVGTGGPQDGGDGVIAAGTSIGAPGGVAVDSAGNVYVSDIYYHRIRKITTSGLVTLMTTIAGTGLPGYSGDGGPAKQAALNNPRGLRVDAAGNVYFADSGNGRIRKIGLDGSIITVAGGGSNHVDNVPATATSLYNPVALDFDAAGNTFVLEISPPRVRKIAADRTVTTVAGTGDTGVFAGDGGLATAAQFQNPSGIAVEPSGNVLVADGDDGRVRRFAVGGTIATIAGNGLYRFSPEGTQAILAFLKGPAGVAIAPDGRVYFADSRGYKVYRVETSGALTTVAGNGINGTAPPGPVQATQVPITAPQGVALDKAGNLYFSDSYRVRRVTPDGTMTTFAGGGANSPGDGGPAVNAYFGSIHGLTFDASGNLFIADAYANRVRLVTPAGIISTVAGSGVAGFSGDGGLATAAQLNQPYGVAVDAGGNLFVAELQNHRVRKVSPSGIISTFAGSSDPNAPLGDGGPATAAHLGLPSDVAVDAAGVVYVVDNPGQRVRRITTDGNITTLAGNGVPTFAGDGGPAQQASLWNPGAVAVDGSGNIYIGDTDNFRIRVVSAVSPDFTVAPASLSFAAQSGAAPPPAQLVSLSSSVVGLPYTISISSDAFWLRATASSLQVPATVQVSVDSSRLAYGAYQGTITFGSSVAGAETLTVILVVTPPSTQPPQLALDSTGVSFSFARGGTAATRRVVVSNNGGGSAQFSAAVQATGGNWLSVSPASGGVAGVAPVSLMLTADPTGLVPGPYSATLIVTDTGSGAVLRVPVSMTISPSGQSIRLSQRGLTFTAVAGGGKPDSQAIAVINSGTGTVQFTAQPIVSSGAPAWLSVSPASGSSDAAQPAPNVTVSVDPTGLDPGDYYGRIEVRSSTADNSPQYATIVLNLLPAGAQAGPVVQPSGLVFTGVAGGGDPGSQTVVVTNLTAAPISFGSGIATVDDVRYIQYQPASASVPPGSLRLVVQPSLAGLTPGVYRGAITLVFSDSSIRPIAILLVVAPPGTKPNAIHAAAAGCAPSQLLPVITSLGANFSIPAGWPALVETRVVDDCGNAVTNGSVVATFSNNDPPLALRSLQDGRWTATWAVRNSSASALSVTVTAETQQPALKGTVNRLGGLNGAGDPPFISPNAVLNAASYALQAPLAPGSMVAIFGSSLSDGSAVATSLPLDTQLAGTGVIVAGMPAPLLASNGGQVNAILPLGLNPNTTTQMIVTRGLRISLPEDISIAAAQPGVFTTNGSGGGQGFIFVVTSSRAWVLADSSAPAKAGDVLVIYCSGLGGLDHTVPEGAPAPSSPLAYAANPVTVSIGGKDAKVTFAGLAPGFSSLGVVYAVVPDGVAAGKDIPLVITAAGQSSVPVTMAVQ